MKIGDIVELKHDPGRYAVIELIYTNPERGVRLDRVRDGFYSWNMDDLQIATPPEGAQVYRDALRVKEQDAQRVRSSAK